MTEILSTLLRKRRKYAPFTEWSMAKTEMEMHVVSSLFAALAAQGTCRFSNARRFMPDPPDIIADETSGGVCGIEVIELVDGQLATIRQSRSGPQRSWQSGEFIAEIASILQKKDGKRFNGGPYSHRTLCIFTGEPLLGYSDAQRELATARFGPFQQLSDGYLLFPFDTINKACPVVGLHFLT